MRQVIIGATAAQLAQLAQLEELFPHSGPSRMVAGDSYRHSSNDKRQIVAGYPQIVGGYPQIVGGYPQIVGAPERHERRQIVAGSVQLDRAGRHGRRQIVGGYGGARHERRQIVGAHVEAVEDSGDFKVLGLPITSSSGTSIAAGATSDFELKPNRLFLPGELVFPSAIAPNLIMTSLLIGGENCLLSTGAIPCDAFNNLTVHKPFKAWTASNAQPITFTLKNIHASAAQVVFGVWWGLAEV